MNKADLLEQLQGLITDRTGIDFDQGVHMAIELVEQLTCITDATFPAVIKEPVPIRDYGVLYLVKDASTGWYYITRQDEWLYRYGSDTAALRAWILAVNKHYPETRETE